MITAQQVDEMTRGYITAALWADCVPLRCEHCGGAGADPDAETSVLCPVCEGADPEESGNLGHLKVDAKSLRYVWALCRYFADLHEADLTTFASLRRIVASEGTVWDHIGHDLRLTSGHHGTGFWDRDPDVDSGSPSDTEILAFYAARAALTAASELAPFDRIGGGDCFQTDEDTASFDFSADAALLRFRAMANGYPDPETGEAFSSAQRQHWVETGEIVETADTYSMEG